LIINLVIEITITMMLRLYAMNAHQAATVAIHLNTVLVTVWAEIILSMIIAVGIVNTFWWFHQQNIAIIALPDVTTVLLLNFA
jgi:hypothetical protein